MGNKMEPKVLQDSPDCEHLWLDYEPGPCPTCAEIRAAEDKRGKEVLELVCARIKSFRDQIPESLMSTPTILSLQATENDIRQAYQERFGE